MVSEAKRQIFCLFLTAHHLISSCLLVEKDSDDEDDDDEDEDELEEDNENEQSNAGMRIPMNRMARHLDRHCFSRR